MISWKEVVQISQTILHGRDAILRVRDKLLISNMIPQLWADVKYHVPTGFGFSPKASGFYPQSPNFPICVPFSKAGFMIIDFFA